MLGKIVSVLCALGLLFSVVPMAQAQGQVIIQVVPPPPPPPAPFNIQVNQTVVVNGITYTVAGNLTATPQGVVPSPVITQVLGAGNAATTTAPGGSAVTIVGTNLGTAGTVSFAGLSATTTSWSPTAIVVTVPKPAGGTAQGPIVVTPSTSPAITSPFVFSITAGSTDNPFVSQPWLFVSGFQDKNGTVMPASIVAGDPFTILGHLFGIQNPDCRVEVNERKATILNWADEAIQVQTDPLYFDNIHEAQVLVWRSLDSYDYSMASFKLISPS